MTYNPKLVEESVYCTCGTLAAVPDDNTPLGLRRVNPQGQVQASRGRIYITCHACGRCWAYEEERSHGT